MADGWRMIGDDVYFNGVFVFTFRKSMMATIRQQIEYALGLRDNRGRT